MVTATGGQKGSAVEELWAALETYLAAEDVELDDLDIRGRGNGRIVRVVVDAAGGIGVDRLATLSRGMSRLLDDTDPIAGGYTLEVTSPGLERSLRRPSHFKKAIGREVDVRTTDEIEGSRHHRGTLESADADTLHLVVDGAVRSVPMRSVTQARTIFRWEKAPKPGGKRGKR